MILQFIADPNGSWKGAVNDRQAWGLGEKEVSVWKEKLHLHSMDAVRWGST